MKRRQFLRVTSGVIASSGVASLNLSFGKNKSTLETLRVAAVGFGGRGKALISAANASKNAKVVALADADEKILNNPLKDDSTIIRETDFRRLLDRKDIDVIISATPNHWHALLTVFACQAGKHVYIEKPISHNMFESRAVVAAADRYKKMVQCGFQNRSDTGVFPFFDRLNAGEFGKVTSVHGTCHRGRNSIGKTEKALKVPNHINYEMWLGPAADQPIYRPRLHYDWHWDFNTGNGDVGNQGPHEWDLMNWALGDSAQLPSSIKACGNRFGWNDAGNTPNVMAVSGVMNKVPFFFEVMDLRPGVKPPHGRGVGVIVETEKGRFVGGRGGGTFTHKDGKKEAFKRTAGRDGTNDHMQNFFDAVLTDDRSKLKSDCKVAAKSSSMAHMANISYQMGESCQATELHGRFAKTDAEKELIERLIQAPEIYHKKHGETATDWVAGPALSFDNGSSKFSGALADAANQKMSRDYRTDFQFPNG